MANTELSYKKVCIIVQKPTTREEVISFDRLQSAILRNVGLDCTVFIISDYEEIASVVQQEMLAGTNLVLVQGDEYTIGEVATNLYLSGIPMAIIPYDGNANLLKQFGIQVTADQILQALCSGVGQMVWLDLGQFEEELFFSGITVGTGDHQLVATNPSGDKILPIAFQLELDGVRQDVTGTRVTIAPIGCIPTEKNKEHGWLQIYVQDDTLTPENQVHYKARRMTIKTGNDTAVCINRTVHNGNHFQFESISKAIPLLMPVAD